TEISNNENITLSVPVTNTGKRNGTEIVQVYLRKVGDSEGPLKTLRGFKRIVVPAGKTATAVINLPPAAFEFYDAGFGKITVAAGEYAVLYGNSSAEKDL